MAEKFKFRINRPAEITFSPKPDDWFAELNHHEEYGDSWRYKFSVSAQGGYTPAQGHVIFAPPDLHELIQRAGCRRGDTIEIGKLEDEEDAKKRYWALTKGGVTYTSRDGAAPAQDTAPEQPPGQPAAQPADAPHDGNSHGRPALTFKQACRELGCLYWQAGRIAAHTSALLDKEVCPTTFFLELRKMGQRPDEETMREWIAARPKLAPPGAAATLRPGSGTTLRPGSGTTLRPGSGTTDRGTPAGSGPIGPEGYFALLDEATRAGVKHANLHGHMAESWRAHLKAAPDGPLPKRGQEIDFSLFPEVLANDVALWVEVKGRELAESQEVTA